LKTDAQRKFLIRAFYYALILAIAIFVCRYAIPALWPFVVAFLVALLLKPIVRFLHEKLRIQKGIAAVVMVLIFYTIAALFIVLISIKLFTSAKAFVIDLPRTYTNSIEPTLALIADYIHDFIAQLEPSAAATFNNLVDGFGASIRSSILDFSAKALSMVGGYAVSIPGLLLDLLIMVIATVFVTSDLQLIKRFLVHQLSDEQHAKMHAIKVHLSTTLWGYIRSYGLILTVTFCELSLGLFLIGFKNPIPIALLIAVFDILPVVGCGTVMMPWAIISFLLGNYYNAIWLAVLWVIITIVRNIIEPKIVGQQVGLHAIVTLMAMVVGTYVFGPIGLLGFPIALALGVSLNEAGVINFYRELPKDEPEAKPKKQWWLKNPKKTEQE